MDARSNLRLDFGAIKQQQQQQPTHSSEILRSPEPGRLNFPDTGREFVFTASDLVEEECIGIGNYGGVVQRMVHRPTGNVMAVKRVRALEIDPIKRDKMLRELRIIIQSQNCEDIVRFYGALFHDGDCWICMELLDCSLDKFYRQVYKQNQRLPVRVIGFITTAVVRALSYLKEKLNIIHRDVKPSNILLSHRGFVKLCDFGISGYLVDSIAETQDVGCQVYMAPERLTDGRRYDIRSDVWSLGITLVEICVGHFPYSGWNTVFDQLQAVVHGDPPFLQANEYYTIDLVNFVNQCLIKDTKCRPKFNELMEHDFFKKYNFLDAQRMAEERQFFGAYVHDNLLESPSEN